MVSRRENNIPSIENFMGVARSTSRSIAGSVCRTDLFFLLLTVHKRSMNVLYALAGLLTHVLPTRDGDSRVRTISETLELLAEHPSRLTEIKKDGNESGIALYGCREHEMTDKNSELNELFWPNKTFSSRYL